MLTDVKLKPDEVQRFADVLRDNTVVCMQTVLMAANDWELIHTSESQKSVTAVLHETTLTEELAEHIATLAATDVVQSVLERSNELQLPGGGSGALYFFTHCKRFATTDFVPTEEDIMRLKLRSTGIIEASFSYQGALYTLVDVGGQRSERRKWLNCFGGVAAVIFLAALNEYDMVLEEDNVTNRMEESLQLFRLVTGSEWLENVPWILFLNKADLFAEKIKTNPLNQNFKDYETFLERHPELKNLGDEEAGVEYIKHKYTRKFNGSRLYTYKTCAIDRTSCDAVFGSIKNSVIRAAMADFGGF